MWLARDHIWLCLLAHSGVYEGDERDEVRGARLVCRSITRGRDTPMLDYELWGTSPRNQIANLHLEHALQ